MSGRSRKTYDADFKVQVVMESMQRDTTIEQIRIKYGIGPNVVNKWRAQFKQNAYLAFVTAGTKKKERPKGLARAFEEDHRGVNCRERHTKKSLERLGLSKQERRDLALAVAESEEKKCPKRVLASAFGISRQSLYYKHRKPEQDNEIRKQIEKIYETDDTLGCRKLSKMISKSKGCVYRVMLKYGIKPRRKRRAYKYPGKADDVVENKLLTKDVEENTILFSDIFQFRLADGSWVYCCFVMREKTRQILSFCYSWGMRAELVAESVKRLDFAGDLSDLDVIFHSDQGRQYGAKITIDSLIAYKYERSMSRAGTPTDNGKAERFVGTFKLAVTERYSYRNLGEFVDFATKWLNFYNEERPHQSLKQISPNEYARQNDMKTIPYLFPKFV